MKYSREFVRIVAAMLLFVILFIGRTPLYAAGFEAPPTDTLPVRVGKAGMAKTELQIACQTEQTELKVDTLHGSYVQETFKLVVQIVNVGDGPAFDVEATALSLDKGLLINGMNPGLAAVRLDAGAPVVTVEWDATAMPREEAALVEVLFFVHAKDSTGAEIMTKECKVFISIPALPRPELTCTITSNVTTFPDDHTIEWDVARGDYEGEESEIGDYTVFTITVMVTNNGTGRANRTRATLLLPEDFTLEEGETAIKLVDPEDVEPGQIAVVRWKVRPNAKCSERTRRFEVLVISENGSPARCEIAVKIATKPCIVNLMLPDDAVGASGQLIAIPLRFKSSSEENVERYRLMIGFDPALLRFNDVVAVGSRTAEGWRGPRAELLTRPGATNAAVVVIDDLTLDSDKRIVFGEEGTLVFLRFEIMFNPVFSASGGAQHVSVSALNFITDLSLPAGRRILSAFNANEEDQYSYLPVIFNDGQLTVTSPCAWPLESTQSLAGNRPNPFNPSTTIAYDLRQEMHVTLVVMDIFGRELRVLDRGLRDAGRHEIVFDAGDIAGGVYFYQLRTPIAVETRRMILLR